VYRYSAVEIEIAWRLLLEPEPVVVGRVLKEVGRFLEDVVALLARFLLDRAGNVVLGSLLAVIERLLGRVGLPFLVLRHGLVTSLGRCADRSWTDHGRLAPGRRGLRLRLRLVLVLPRVIPLRLAVSVGELVLDTVTVGPDVFPDGRLILGGFSRFAPHWTKRLMLGALDLRRVGAAAALQVKVLADRIVQQTHVCKAYSPLNTFAVCADPRRV
jgi:hypothetical protein